MSDGPACPLPISDYPHVLLAHGGGGRLTQMLIERVFLEAFRKQPKDVAIMVSRAGFRGPVISESFSRGGQGSLPFFSLACKGD